MKLIKGFGFALAALFISSIFTSAFAEEDRIKELERNINELSRELETIKASDVDKKINAITEDIEKLKLGAVAEPKYESFMGLGPAASKVYGIDKGLSLGGYGEVVYSNYQDSTKKDFADALRFILYGGYKFNDWIIMNTELEF